MMQLPRTTHTATPASMQVAVQYGMVLMWVMKVLVHIRNCLSFLLGYVDVNWTNYFDSNQEEMFHCLLLFCMPFCILPYKTTLIYTIFMDFDTFPNFKMNISTFKNYIKIHYKINTSIKLMDQTNSTNKILCS